METLTTTNTPRAADLVGLEWRNVYPAEEKSPGEKDNVKLPSHYARWKIEPIHFIGENGLDWFQGNIVKYVMRHDAKNGIEDLRKARRYLDMYISKLSGDADWWYA